MNFNEHHMKTIIMFNKTYQRACWHKKKRVRKKNYARAQYMLRRGLLQISRNGRADNVFYTYYDADYLIEEIDD